MMVNKNPVRKHENYPEIPCKERQSKKIDWQNTPRSQKPSIPMMTILDEF